MTFSDVYNLYHRGDVGAAPHYTVYENPFATTYRTTYRSFTEPVQDDNSSWTVSFEDDMRELILNAIKDKVNKNKVSFGSSENREVIPDIDQDELLALVEHQ